MTVKADHSNVDPGVQLLELVQKVGTLYLAQPTSERRRSTVVVLSNCVWEDGKLIVKFRKPFDLLAVTTEKTATLVAVGGPVKAECPEWLLLEQRIRNLLFMPTPSLVAAIEACGRLSLR